MMDRDVLQIFLRSGPARKYDVGHFSKRVTAETGEMDNLLFKTHFLNYAILFKSVVIDKSHTISDSKPISTIIYSPYDYAKPGDGGESFVFSEDNFQRFYQYKLRSESVDVASFSADLEVLAIFNSVPTFSPIIIELAFTRANMRPSNIYFDLTPELRVKLNNHMKARIRPLIVAAYERSSCDIERAVEEMTSKLLYLQDAASVMPLIEALRLAPDTALEVLSSWIGITYFEYEYAALQPQLRAFSEWITKNTKTKDSLRPNESEYLATLSQFVRQKMKEEWARVVDLSKTYRETYHALVFKGDIKRFSEFLYSCRHIYWDLGETLGRFEQTTIAWRLFERQLMGQKPSYRAVLAFYTVLRKLLGAPPAAAAPVAEDTLGETRGGFSTLTADLF